MSKAYQFHDYNSAAQMLYQLNGLIIGFGAGISDLPFPNNPDRSDINDRRSPEGYYKMYYEQYCPLLMKSIGKYLREILDAIKNERGFD